MWLTVFQFWLAEQATRCLWTVWPLAFPDEAYLNAGNLDVPFQALLPRSWVETPESTGSESDGDDMK